MKYRLEEIFDLQMGKTPSRNNPDYWQSKDNKWISIADLTKSDKYIENTKEYISDKAVEESGISLIPANTVIMSFKLSIGKTAVTTEPMYSNEAIMSFRDKHLVDLLPDYIYYLLSGKKWDEGTNKAVMGKTLNKATLSNVIVNIDNINKQKEIVNRLDELNSIIANRKKELQKLDELIKARFVEMFGDTEDFSSVSLEESVEEMFIGPFGSSLKNECFVSKEEGFCMVYEQKHAIRKTMDVETRFVDKSKYKELERFTVKGGDIIVSCRGTIGETFIVPPDAPLGIMHPSIMKIRLKKDTYDCTFFDYLLQNALKKHEAEANGSGVKMAITATALGKEKFIIPSMNLQKHFSAFVQQVDKSKFVK